MRFMVLVVLVLVTGCGPKCVRSEKRAVYHPAVADMWIPLPVSYDGKTTTIVLTWVPGSEAFTRIEDVCVERAQKRAR